MARKISKGLKKDVDVQDMLDLEKMFEGSDAEEEKLWGKLEKKRETIGIPPVTRLTRRHKDHRFLKKIKEPAQRVHVLKQWISEIGSHDEEGEKEQSQGEDVTAMPIAAATTEPALPSAEPVAEAADISVLARQEGVSETLRSLQLLLAQTDKYIRHENLQVADICYKQIQPFYDTLSDDERRMVYPHLVSLQNRLIMLQMKSLRESLTPQEPTPAKPVQEQVTAKAPTAKRETKPTALEEEMPVVDEHHPSLFKRVLHFLHLDTFLHPSAKKDPSAPVQVPTSVPSEIVAIEQPKVRKKRERVEPVITQAVLETVRPEMPIEIVQEESPKTGMVSHLVEAIARGIGIHKEEYVRTGIPGLDQLFEKGIPKGSTVVIAGGAGSGKTILGLQILAEHALHGEKCLYMSFEESEERLVHHMEDFGWEPQKYIAEGNLLIRRFNPFDITRSVDALLMEEKGELLIDVKPVILPEGFVPTFVVVDSLTAIASAFSGKETSYRIYIEQLFRFFENLGATAFLVSETKQIPTVYSTNGVEEFLADGVVVLYSFRVGNVRENAIEVLKLRGAKHQKKVVAMQVTSQGIVVYPEQEVFGIIEAKEQ